MKIGVVYCKKDQKMSQDMFANKSDECQPDFWNFLSFLGPTEKIKKKKLKKK